MSTPQETPRQAAERRAASAVREGYVFQALHVYNAPDGTPLHWKIRLKHPETGEKWIRPMMLNGHGFELKEPDYPEGKPLYGLDCLTADPSAPVCVVEGEPKVDTLLTLGVLATTSGAADSAGGADWRPLTGRQVTIWPDHDPAGQRYAAAVATALTRHGGVVRVIDVEALGLPAKGDVAEWLAAHPEATAANIAALPTILPPPPTEEPPTATHEPTVESHHCGTGRYEVSDKGVQFIADQTDSDSVAAPQWIRSPLRVVAMTRDAVSRAWGRLLEWKDDDGVRHEWAMPMDLLQGDGADMRRELAARGLSIAPSRSGRDRLMHYVQVWPVDARARCVDRPGWHGPVFVTPTEAIGASDERVVFQNAHAIEPALSASCTMEDWRESVAALAAGNTRVVFAISVAFAGPLAELVGEDSGGFHVRGASSSGKSTALRAAASVWGPPRDYMRTWRATANGLEGLAALHNDGTLILDELGQIDPKEAGEAAYMLANGQGKARASRTGAARAAYHWRLLLLSSGEESLAALMARGGKRATAGQEIRLADIDADAGAGMGAFEALHDHPTPAAFAVALRDAADQAYGAVGRAWLAWLVPDRATLAQVITDEVRQFSQEVVPTGATGQAVRVARRFGLVAIAGELATHCGLTGWPVGESEQAAKACYAAWLTAFGGLGNREERMILEQVRAFFESHGASRFQSLKTDDTRIIINRAGFVRDTPDNGREYLVFPGVFERDVCVGLDANTAKKVLVAHGWIERGGDKRPTQKLRLPGMTETTRMYVFTSRVWETEE